MPQPQPSHVRTMGRFANYVFMCIPFSIFAKKFDLKVIYGTGDDCINLFNQLGLHLFSGSKSYRTTIEINSKNFMSIFNKHEFKHRFIKQPGEFFQDNNNFLNLVKYYFIEKQDDIIKANPYKERYNNNNDIHVHIRLGDMSKRPLPIGYFINTINNINNYDNLYISSDSYSRAPLIKNLLSKFPNAILKDFDSSPIPTLQFASTCKYNILSCGSYSALIGYLSFFSKVYYMDFDTIPAYKMWFAHTIYYCRHDWIKCLHQEKTMVTDTGSADTSEVPDEVTDTGSADTSEVPDEVTDANNNDNL